MNVLRTIVSLHDRLLDDGDDGLPPASPAQLAELEQIVGAPLPGSVRAYLESKASSGVVVEPDFEAFYAIQFEGLPTIEQCLADNDNLAKARAEYTQFERVDPCVVISLVNNEFVAVRLADEQMLRVDGDDGDVEELGVDFGGFLDRYVELVGA